MYSILTLIKRNGRSRSLCIHVDYGLDRCLNISSKLLHTQKLLRVSRHVAEVPVPVVEPLDVLGVDARPDAGQRSCEVLQPNGTKAEMMRLIETEQQN